MNKLETIQSGNEPTMKTFTHFVLETRYHHIPEEVSERAKDLVLDLIGVSAAAHEINASRIGRETAVHLFNAGTKGDQAQILFDGRTASQVGAAYAGATQIDSLDAHDGFSSAKGHAGCGLFPAVLAFAEGLPDLSGSEFLAAMVVGYEIAIECGVADNHP
jgi:2-methylcitrate dehydratase PrpD